MASALIPMVLTLLAMVFGQPELSIAGEPGRGQTCDPRSYLSHWTRVERRIWTEVCHNRPADLDEILGIGPHDREQLETWEPERKLRADFLAELVFHAERPRKEAHYRIEIKGAWFDQPIKLEYASLPLLWLDWCRFDAPVSFAYSSFPATLSLEGSRLQGSQTEEALKLDFATIAGELNLIDTSSQAEISAIAVEIDGTVSLGDVELHDKLILNSAIIGGHIQLASTTIHGQLDLIGSKIAGELNIGGSSKVNWLDANTAKVGRDVMIAPSARIDAIDMGFAEVGGALFIGSGTTTGHINLQHAKVAGEIGISTRRPLSLPEEQPDLPLAQIDLRQAKGGDSLNLSLAGNEAINLTGATIGYGLRFRLDQPASAAVTMPNISLDMRNVEAFLLEGPGDFLPTDLDLVGARFRQIGGRSDSCNDMGPTLDTGLCAWLEQSQPFSFGVYQSIADTIENGGDTGSANDIRYAGKERARRDLQENGRSYVAMWQGLLGFTIGYGYGDRIFWCLRPMVVLVLMGAVVAMFSTRDSAVGERPSNLWKQGASRLRRFQVYLRFIRRWPSKVFDDLFLSLDLLIPTFELDKAHYSRKFAWPGRYYFYFHRLMGLILGIFLLAGITGLVG